MKKFFVNFMLAAVTVVGLATSACTTDLCKDKDCGTHGTCDAVDGSCVCDAGYEADANGACNTEMRAKFLNTAGYAVVETGVSTDPFYNGTFNYSVDVVTSNSGVDKVIFKKFGALGCSGVDLEVIGTVSEKTKITFSSSSCSDIVINGTGTIDAAGKVITATWTGTAPAGGTGPTTSSFNSTGTFTKK